MYIITGVRLRAHLLLFRDSCYNYIALRLVINFPTLAIWDFGRLSYRYVRPHQISGRQKVRSRKPTWL